MMRKVQIGDPGDTEYLPEELVDKWEFMDANDAIFGKYYVLDPGDSVRFEEGDIIGARDMRGENASLERQGMKMMVVREAKPATASQILQGITRAASRPAASSPPPPSRRPRRCSAKPRSGPVWTTSRV